MNPSKLVLFESVRSVLTGRIQDDDQVRDIAARVADESADLRRRIERAVGYARAGLRLEACAEAESDPTIHELSIAFSTPDMQQWSEHCSNRGLPRPERPSEEAIGEIDEAIALTAPLRGRLALMRVLVLADAPAWKRLEVLRDLVARDPENPAWTQDRDDLELVAAAELNAAFDQALLLGNVEHARACVARLEDGRWHQPIAARLAAQCRRRLDQADAERATGDAAAIMQRIETEWSAENDEGARAALLEWDALAHRIAECGGTIPDDLAARATAAAAWLAGRDANAEARRENAELVDALDRASRDQRTGLAELRRALRAAEQAIEGVPDDVRSFAESRIEELERMHRVRRTVLAVSAAAAVVILGAFTFLWLGERREETDIDREVARGLAAIAGPVPDVAAARRVLTALESDPDRMLHPDVQELRTSVIRLEVAAKERIARYDEYMRLAGDASSAAGRPALAEKARQEAGDDKERRDRALAWLEEHRSSSESRERDRVDALATRIRDLQREASSAAIDASPKWDGVIAAWRRSLQDIRGEAGAAGPQLAPAAQLCETAIQNKQTELERARAGADRETRIADLSSAASAPAQLAAALERYAKDHPDAPQVADFREALAARPAWEALAAWPGLRAEPQAGRTQAELQAAAAAIDDHEAKHPKGPLASECAALRPLLGPFTGWRTALRSELGQPRYSWYLVTFRDDGGAVRVAHTKDDPKDARRQRSPAGVEQVVLTLTDGSIKSVDAAGVSSAPSPEMELAGELRRFIAEDGGRGNDTVDALEAVKAIAAAPRLDARSMGPLLQLVLAAMAEEMPAPVGIGARVAETKVAEATRKASGAIDAARGEAKAAEAAGAAGRKAMREAIEADRWQKEWDRALAAAAKPLRARFVPAGVLLRPASGAEIRLQEPAEAGAQAFAVRRDGAVEQLGTATGGTAAAVAPGADASAFPAGTMVFLRKKVAP
jgi:hypothetical protein